MYQKGLVSVIIPAYNSQNHIIYTLLSVIDQTYPYIETIVVDDGSTDGTQSIVQQFEKKSIRYIYQPNAGSAVAKNTGLSYASGEYIQFLDADDLLANDKIQKQVAALRYNPGKVAVCKTSGFPYMGDIADLTQANEIDTAFLYSTNDTLQFLKDLNGASGKIGMVQPNAYLTPRTVIDRAGWWSTELSRSPDDDSEFFCRVLLQAAGIVYVTDTMNYYRQIPIKTTLSRRRSPDYAKGALRTIELKTQHLLKVADSVTVKTMMATQFANYMYLNYQHHPELCKRAEQDILDLGFSGIPAIGENTFMKVARLIGFKNTLRIKKIISAVYS